jgi:large subunit ribosomal protein L1
MGKKTKRAKAVAPMYDATKLYNTLQAIEILKNCPPVRFDPSIDIAIKLGVDPKKSDQNVRGTVSLPHGTGRKKVVLVLARGDKAKEAEAAGADFVGSDDLVEKIAGGWTGFDSVIATPDLMREVGKLGKVLGPRGLMPTPKAGTVTNDVAGAVKEIKQGKIEFKSDKFGVVNCAIGKQSFQADQIAQNFNSVLSAIQRAKPSTVKGIFLQSGYLSSTMGPGLKVEIRESEAAG